MIKSYPITAMCFERVKSQKTEEWMILVRLYENHLLRHKHYLAVDAKKKYVRDKAHQFIRDLLVNKGDWSKITEENRNVESLFNALVDLPSFFKDIIEITIDDSGDFPELIDVKYKQ